MHMSKYCKGYRDQEACAVLTQRVCIVYLASEMRKQKWCALVRECSGSRLGCYIRSGSKRYGVFNEDLFLRDLDACESSSWGGLGGGRDEYLALQSRGFIADFVKQPLPFYSWLPTLCCIKGGWSRCIENYKNRESGSLSHTCVTLFLAVHYWTQHLRCSLYWWLYLCITRARLEFDNALSLFTINSFDAGWRSFCCLVAQETQACCC
jgi:hypothetical protein